MPYAVTLCVDAATDRVVTALLHALADNGIDDDRLKLGYRAHVTLAIFGDDAPMATVDAAVSACAATWSALPVCFAGFGVFPAAPSPEARSIVFLAPVVSAALLACHADLHAALAGLECDPHYRAGAWVPHITLGAAAVPAAALAVLAPLWRGPIVGRFARVDLVRFRPVDILRSIPLSCEPDRETHT